MLWKLIGNEKIVSRIIKGSQSLSLSHTHTHTHTHSKTDHVAYFHFMFKSTSHSKANALLTQKEMWPKIWSFLVWNCSVGRQWEVSYSRQPNRLNICHITTVLLAYEVHFYSVNNNLALYRAQNLNPLEQTPHLTKRKRSWPSIQSNDCRTA